MNKDLLYELESLIERARNELSDARDDAKYLDGSTGIALVLSIEQAQEAVNEVRLALAKAVAKEEKLDADTY